MNKELKLITYNVDGLPEELDLSTLPWILRPIAWVYKLFKGTTIIKVNDNNGTSEKMKTISERLLAHNADIIGVQEDFNYHDELMSSLNSDYNDFSHSGEILLDNLFSRTEWLSCFPLPRFKCDGLNLIIKAKRINSIFERIFSWKKSYGYFTHANDKLTHKGFRYYPIFVDGEVVIDVYIVHMDADFYNAESCPDVSKDVNARKSQLKQLTKYILEGYDGYGWNVPIIIMGDTNSSPNYEWDINNINENLIEPINATEGLTIKEVIPSNRLDVDRVFYINPALSKYVISPKECYFDEGFNGLSDHMPLVTTFNIDRV
jgi:exonuclease III